MRNSSCMTSWDGLSLSALSQSPEHPALDQTPGEKAVKGELCSNSLAKRVYPQQRPGRCPGKSSFLPFPIELQEE